MRAVAGVVMASIPLIAVVVGAGVPVVVHADSTPWVTVNDVTMPRPTSGTTTFAFVVSLSHTINTTAYVGYATADGSARSTFDYQPVSGTATFAPGKTTQTVNVTVNGTTLHTGDRYFSFNLNNAIHAQVQHSGTGTIVDTTLLPYLNVSDASVTQGSGTSNSAVFNVSLSSPSQNKVRVRYYTSSGSATSGVDFTSVSGILIFPPAVTSQQITVPITAVSIYQGIKYFNLNLYQPTNAVLGNSSGRGTIFNSNHIAYLTSDDVTVAEPGSGTASVNVPIRVTPLSPFPVTVAYTTSNGSAVSGSDYTTASGTITIPANTAQVTVPVTANASGVTTSKYFAFNLSSPSAGASPIRGTSYVTIAAGSYNQLAVADVAVLAPTTGTSSETFTVTLSPASAGTVSVNYQTADSSALAGTHYVATSGTLTFTPGQTSKTVTVTVKADTSQFTDVQYSLNLSSASAGTTLDRSIGYGTIQASGSSPMISIASTPIAKPASGTVSEPFTVSLSTASVNTVTVNYGTSNGSAIAGSDYTATTGTLTFAPSVTTLVVNVTITGNTIAGSDLYYYLNLTTATNAQLATGSVAGYIQNPNHNPTLSINTIAVYKPQKLTAPAKLTVTLSSSSPNAVTVNYATGNGSATAGLDYTAASGTLTFTPGTTAQSITLAVTGNTLPTGDRYFYVNLGSPVNASLVTSQGYIDIIDSSIVPYVSIGATAVQKPSTGTASAVFTITLSPASPNTVTVNYATSNGSATAGVDYAAATGTVTFNPGISSRTVTVVVNASTIHTQDRYFYLNLASPVNALLGQSSGVAWIIDPTFNPDLTVDDTAILKPTSGTALENFTIHLYPASLNTVTVNYVTGDGSAIAGSDYIATSGTLTFNPGTTSQMVAVTVNGSASSVPDRYFTFNLNSATNAQLAGRSSGYGQIIDQVAPTSGVSWFTVQDDAILKPAGGTAIETFGVNLFPAPTSPVNVNYLTSDGSAVAGAGDYVAARGTLTFGAGVSSQTISVTVNGNTMPSSDKYFSINLGSNTGPTQMFQGTSYGFILNNQPDNRIWVGPDLVINRGTSGSQNVNFSVSLSAPQQFTVQVDYSTNDGSAVAPDGYTPEAGTLTFAPGQTTQSIAVGVPGNPAFTGVQYFTLNLSNPVNTTVGASSETAYVYNLDTFAVTGKVVGTTGSGLAGVTITMAGNNLAAVVVTTAADGTFSVLNTINGTYTITPTMAGETFLPANMSVTVRGAAAVNSPFLGFAGTGIYGVVADTSGKALAGVTVTRTGGGAATVATTTDTLGYYAYDNVAAGSGYAVTPAKTGFTFNPGSYTINVASATLKNQDFVAMQGVTISGQVTFGGAGVPGVTITRTGGGQPTVLVTTNSQGYFGFSNTFATVPGVTYTITPTKTGKTFTPVSAPATVTTTSNASGVNFTQN